MSQLLADLSINHGHSLQMSQLSVMINQSRLLMFDFDDQPGYHLISFDLG